MLYACTVSSLCDEDQFTCDSGECVPHYDKCDKIEDCSDGSDELNCGKLLCHSAPVHT